MLFYPFLAALPPILVLLSVILTRSILISFIIGILSGSYIANGEIVDSFYLTVRRFLEGSGLNKISTLDEIWNNWSLSILIFLICTGILIVLLQESGSVSAFAKITQKHIKSKKSVEIYSLLLSFVFFIDDYFSILTVGSIMHPLTLLYHVHPVKLAYLVMAVASPLTILFPLSSWAGEIILNLRQSGIGVGAPGAFVLSETFNVFLLSIPFILYAFFSIITAWYIVWRKISYGPMALYENQNLPFPKENYIDVSNQETDTSLFDFTFPIAALTINIFLIIMVTGFSNGASTLLESLKYGSIQKAFLLGGPFAILISTVWFVMRRKINMKSIGSITKKGFWLMAPSLFMLMLVWTLSLILRQDLQTGVLIASLLASFISKLFFPLICFISSTLITWMIASAWAAMGLIFPIVIPMLKIIQSVPPEGLSIDSIPLVLAVIGATLSGCVMGTHLSFISDNAVMASASTGADHASLIKAMAWYVVPVGIATIVGYLLIGILNSFGLTHQLIFSFSGGLIVLVFAIESMQKIFSHQ